MNQINLKKMAVNCNELFKKTLIFATFQEKEITKTCDVY